MCLCQEVNYTNATPGIENVLNKNKLVASSGHFRELHISKASLEITRILTEHMHKLWGLKRYLQTQKHCDAMLIFTLI